MTANLGGLDGLARQAVDATKSAGSGPGDVAGPGRAAENDVERFREAMDAKPAEPAAPTPPPDAAPAAAPADAAGRPDGVADRILRGISSADRRVAEARSETAAVLGKDNVSQADLLRANMAMLESSTLVSAVSKSTEKLTSAVKTLQQG